MNQPPFTFGQTVYFRDGSTSFSKSRIIAIRDMGQSPYCEGTCYEYTVFAHSGEAKRRSDEVADSLDNLKKICLAKEKDDYDLKVSVINGWEELKEAK